MYAHDGRVDDLDGRIMSAAVRPGSAPTLPPSPPDETVEAGDAWAVAIRQIASWCAGSLHPAMPLNTRRWSSRRPRALFGNIGLTAAHS